MDGGREYVVTDLFLQIHQHPGSINLVHYGHADFARSDNYSDICPASKYICYDGDIDPAGFDRRTDLVYDDCG